MRRETGFGILLFCLLAAFVMAVPKTVLAAGMTAETSAQEVQTGTKFPVTVSFSGTEIWFAYVRISFSDPILEGGGAFLIEPDRGSDNVSATYFIKAASPGETVISVEGYTDEDESQVFQASIPITVSGEPETERAYSGAGRAADVDGDFRDASGAYINRVSPSKPEAAGSGTGGDDASNMAAGSEQDKTTSSDDSKESRSSENTANTKATKANEEENQPETESRAVDPQKENNKPSAIWSVVIFGIILLIIGPFVLLIIWYRKKDLDK